MLPIGPLMIEHRLIERMIRVIEERLGRIRVEEKEDPAQVERIIHFIRAYADRCHHGKEEGILFRALDHKAISTEHRRMMDELIKDHELARKITLSLMEYNQLYQKGEAEALADITVSLRLLVDFYPPHIEKEDRHFFIPVMNYFSPEEKEQMIRAGYESDSRIVHEEYADLVKNLEINKRQLPSK